MEGEGRRANKILFLNSQCASITAFYRRLPSSIYPESFKVVSVMHFAGPLCPVAAERCSTVVLVDLGRYTFLDTGIYRDREMCLHPSNDRPRSLRPTPEKAYGAWTTFLILPPLTDLISIRPGTLYNRVLSAYPPALSAKCPMSMRPAKPGREIVKNTSLDHPCSVGGFHRTLLKSRQVDSRCSATSQRLGNE